jgi:uncharacterized membrane protein YphA (DoxX/SURF4 family)
MAKKSSHPLLSHTDDIAAGMTDPLLLIGRVLLALVFLMTVWFGSPNVAYLTSINYMNPEILAPLAQAIVIVATVTAHRYWGYAPAAQGVQYIFLTKNIAIAGGLILLFVTGAGSISVDAILAKKR